MEKTENSIRKKLPEASHKKIWAIIVSSIIILASLTTLVINIDKMTEIYFSQNLQASKITARDLPKSEANTSGDPSPAIIPSGPNSPVPVNHDSPVSKTEQPIELVPNISQQDLDKKLSEIRTSKKLRELTPLETGRSISETPAGTYFFVSASNLKFSDSKIEDMLKDSPVSLNRNGISYFEIYKMPEDQVILLGYVGDEMGALLSNTAEREQRKITLFSLPWENFQNLVMIPVSRIFKSKDRLINTSAGDIVAAKSKRKEPTPFPLQLEDVQNLVMIPVNGIFKPQDRPISTSDGNIAVLDLLIE